MTQINDDLYAFLISEGIPPGHINDMQYTWLIAQGVPAGHISDMWAAYYAVQAIIATALIDLKSEGIIETGPNVTGWTNLGTGGSTYDLDTVLGANDMVVETYAGKKVVHANNASGLSTSSIHTITNPVTVFAVYKIDNIIRAQYIYDGNGAAGRVTHFYGPALSGYRFNAGATYDVLTASTGPQVSGAIYNTASSRCEIGGIENLDPASLGSNNFDWGIVLDNFAGTDHAEAWLGRLLVFDSALTTVQFDDIMTFLRLDWGGI